MRLSGVSLRTRRTSCAPPCRNWPSLAARTGGGAPGLDWQEIDHDLAQIDRLVAQLLDLARKENAGRTEKPAPVNLARLAREAAAMVLPLARAHGRPLDIDLPDALPTYGHADDLRDALRNLLENAVLHGEGRIGLAARLDGAALVWPSPIREAVLPGARRTSSFSVFTSTPRPQAAGWAWPSSAR